MGITNSELIAGMVTLAFVIIASSFLPENLEIVTLALGGIFYFTIILFEKERASRIKSLRKAIIREAYIPYLSLITIVGILQYRGGFDTPYFFLEFDQTSSSESKIVWLLMFIGLSYYFFWLLVRGGIDILIDMEMEKLPIGSNRIPRTKKIFNCLVNLSLFICAHILGYVVLESM